MNKKIGHATFEEWQQMSQQDLEKAEVRFQSALEMERRGERVMADIYLDLAVQRENIGRAIRDMLKKAA